MTSMVRPTVSFFNALSATPSDHVFFEIVGNVGTYAWCGQQASLYRDAYLSLAPARTRAPGTGESPSSRAAVTK